jgi:hypothetical protein
MLYQQRRTQAMATSEDRTGPKTHVPDIDRNAPAGSEHSLGAQSILDGRPATDDSVVEAMDEEGPGIDPLTQDTETR